QVLDRLGATARQHLFECSRQSAILDQLYRCTVRLRGPRCVKPRDFARADAAVLVRQDQRGEVGKERHYAADQLLTARIQVQRLFQALTETREEAESAYGF